MTEQKMPEQLIGDVSDTAFWVAHYRAVEGERPDALFHDPLAGVLAGERGKKIADAMPMTFWTGWSVVLRTCIIDDYIREALAGGVETILNLGAGLDTRPYRMELPESLAWVEADYPHMIELKEERLAKEKPRCRLERVKIDLANVAERRRVLAQVDAQGSKMLVLTEGVVPYLSEDQAASLADDLRAMAHARYWVLDYFSPEVVKYRGRNGMHRHMQNAPFKFAPDDW
ncbi:MAG: class I SAM-dependent methyltransferase, partial [Terracidiphilus sp.]